MWANPPAHCTPLCSDYKSVIFALVPLVYPFLLLPLFYTEVTQVLSSYSHRFGCNSRALLIVILTPQTGESTVRTQALVTTVWIRTRSELFPNARVSPPHPLSGSRRLGGIPLRNFAGKICRLLRANKLDCAPWVGKLDGFLGLGVGRLRIGNCGRGWCLSASASHWALAAGANSTSPRRQGRSFAALARGHIQHARRPCVRPGRGYPSRSAPSRRRALARWLARTPRAAGTGWRR